jgi:hypothetical protein
MKLIKKTMTKKFNKKMKDEFFKNIFSSLFFLRSIIKVFKRL